MIDAAGAPSGATGRRRRREGQVPTSCPSCLQGLSRYRDEVPVEPEYIVTGLAQRRMGAG